MWQSEMFLLLGFVRNVLATGFCPFEDAVCAYRSIVYHISRECIRLLIEHIFATHLCHFKDVVCDDISTPVTYLEIIRVIPSAFFQQVLVASKMQLCVQVCAERDLGRQKERERESKRERQRFSRLFARSFACVFV